MTRVFRPWKVRLWITSMVTLVIAFCSSSLAAQGLSTANEAMTGTPPDPLTVVTVQGVFAFITSWAIEWWKSNPKLSGISHDTQIWVQRLIAVLVATGTSLGIGYQFDPVAGTLLLTGITWSGIGIGIWEAVKQFFFQEYMYRTAFKGK